jgi:uncharacterized protein YgbK (DUF1537 family)
MSRLGIIADDLTGALDTGGQFVKAGLETALLLSPRHVLPVQVQVISTNSRDANVATARQQAAKAAERLRGRLVFKKIDSTMRGHVGPEIEAVLRVTGAEKAVVCPAVIEAGRRVRHGKLWVGDVLLHKSDFAHDPSWPAVTSDMASLLGLPVTHLYLKTVRAGANVLTKAISNAPTQIITVDACDDSDLAVISQAVVAGNYLPCGALGLARAWGRELVGLRRIEPEPALPSSTAPVLVVAGSRHPKTHTQVRRVASERGLAIIDVAVAMNDRDDEQWRAIAGVLSECRSLVIRAPLEEIRQASHRRALGTALGKLTLRVCQEFELGGLVLTGGETASAVCQALETMAVRILGELQVGIPWGRLVGGVASGLPVVTKAGGFGHADSLIRIVDILRGNEPKSRTLKEKKT